MFKNIKVKISNKNKNLSTMDLRDSSSSSKNFRDSSSSSSSSSYSEPSQTGRRLNFNNGKTQEGLIYAEELLSENKYYPLNHEINKINVEKFINASDLNLRPIIRKIINNTIHISFEEFLLAFNDTIKQFLKLRERLNKFNRTIFIYLDTTDIKYKQKSSYWLYTLLISNLDDIKFKLIQYLDDPEIKNDDILILLDDAIYSGNQMATTIRYMTNNLNLKLNICVLVPYITLKGLDLITLNRQYNTSLINCNFMVFSHKIIKEGTYNILTNEEIRLMNSYYPNRTETFENKYLFYFDHKLADALSTIPIFYSGLVPNKNNRNILANRGDKDKLIFIPFINNCENIRNLNNLVPECPYPQYKTEGFLKLIKNIKLNKKDRKANSAPINRRTSINISKRKALSSPKYNYHKEGKTSLVIRTSSKKETLPELFINRLSGDINKRIEYYKELIKNFNLKDDKNYCPKLYKIQNKEPILRIGTNIILKKRIGSESVRGIVYLSSFRDKSQSLFKYAIKLFPHSDKHKDNEIKMVEQVSQLTINHICPHFLIIYKTIKCNNFDIYGNQGTNSSSSKGNVSLQAYKKKEEFIKYYPELLLKNKNQDIYIILTELANGDLKTFLKLPLTITENLVGNIIAQMFISLAFFTHYMKAYHDDTHSGNFLYYKINKGGCFHYNIYSKDYYLENNGYLWLLWDFGRTTKKLDEFSVNCDFWNAIYTWRIFDKIADPDVKLLIINLIDKIYKYNYDYSANNFKIYIYEMLEYFISINILKESPIGTIINRDKPYILK